MPGGDVTKVAIVLGGLFVLVTAGLGHLARRRGLALRQPTPRQRDGFAEPLARILVRHLPLQLIDDDLLDGTSSATAVHDYLTGGPVPLLTRADRPALDANPNRNVDLTQE